MLRNRHLKAALATGLALGAIATPAATALPVPLPADPPCPRCDDSAVARRANGPSVSPVPAIVRVEPKRGFDWGDAGIGAAGALAIALVGFGLTVFTRGRNETYRALHPVSWRQHS